MLALNLVTRHSNRLRSRTGQKWIFMSTRNSYWIGRMNRVTLAWDKDEEQTRVFNSVLCALQLFLLRVRVLSYYRMWRVCSGLYLTHKKKISWKGILFLHQPVRIQWLKLAPLKGQRNSSILFDNYMQIFMLKS